MILTLIPLLLNAGTGIVVWMSELPLLCKILLTITIAAKFGTYFYAALIEATEQSRSIGLVVCAVLNVLLIGYFAWKTIWFAIPGCAALAILAVIWGAISGFSFKKED